MCGLSELGSRGLEEQGQEAGLCQGLNSGVKEACTMKYGTPPCPSLFA